MRTTSGKPGREPRFSVAIRILVEPAMAEWLEKEAWAAGISVSQLCRQILGREKAQQKED